MNNLKIIAVGFTLGTALSVICSMAYVAVTQQDTRQFKELHELGCKDGRDGIGPIFSGIVGAKLQGDTYTLVFVEGGVGNYKMRGGEFCALTSVGDVP